MLIAPSRTNLCAYTLSLAMAWNQGALANHENPTEAVSASTHPIAVIKVTIPSDVGKHFKGSLNGRNPINVTDYKEWIGLRDTVEILLLHKLFAHMPKYWQIEFINEDHYLRVIDKLRSGTTGVSGTTVWLRSIKELNANIVASSAVIQRGEYVVGLYSHKDNLHAQTLVDSRQWHMLSAVSSKEWHVDWETLESLKLRKLYHANDSDLMVKMVSAQRADFLLAPLSTPRSMSRDPTINDLRLLQGVKASLNGSRHWMLSKQYFTNHFAHYGDEKYHFSSFKKSFKEAMNILRNQGEINRAFTDAGIYTKTSNNWPLINPTLEQSTNNK